MQSLPATLELFKVLGDPNRVRLLALLRVDELTVAEIVRVTGLPQPRVSTHLRRLREAGLVADRREGGSSFYGLVDDAWDSTVRAAWAAVEGTGDPVLRGDLQRLQQVVAAREEGVGDRWADSVAGRMKRHYSPGRTWQSLGRGLAGLCRLGRVLDVASGDGAVAELLAPRAAAITCIDISKAVVAAGTRRLAHLDNVKFVHGDMHELPVPDASFEQALILAGLCYAADPVRVLGEMYRALVPGGDLVIVDLCAHPHADVVRRYGHMQNGFPPKELHRALVSAGFLVDVCGPSGRERRPPHFEILTAYARRPAARPESS